MKILFVAVFTPNSTNVYQSRGFKDLGYTVLEYDYRYWSKKLGSENRRDDHLIDYCKETKPDIIVYSKCNNLHYRVIEEHNRIGKTVLWYMDGTEPHCFNKELKDKIKSVHGFACGVEGGVEISLPINENTKYVFQPADDVTNKPLDIKKDIDVCFIGDISNIAGHEHRVEYQRRVKFDHINGVYGSEHNEVVNRTKINLNFAPANMGGCSVRVYKLLLSGAFILTTPWKDMEKTFTIGENIDIFKTPEELKEKIEYYLQNEGKMEEIRNNALELSKNFTVKKWAEQIVSF